VLAYPEINPIAFHLGPLAVHWYGLMYLIGFSSAWWLLRQRMKTSILGLNANQISDLIFYAAIGIIIGGRLGYMVFYDWPTLRAAPWQLFAIWHGGMSFHGGLLGVIIALGFYANKTGKGLIAIADFIAPVVPIGLAAGRIGNFINGELWGRVTDVPWAMIFPGGGDLPRHPSQLYEFFCEGVILFIMLWVFSKKKRPLGAVSGLFLLCYGLIRFGLEFLREPDQQIGFVAFGWLTKGQLLSLPMIGLGVLLLVWAYKRKV
jgi:phosphatidylglycerol:prolipoprotein diacylglycerol transferase